jgi:hypothetical protein
MKVPMPAPQAPQGVRARTAPPTPSAENMQVFARGTEQEFAPVADDPVVATATAVKS